MANWFRYFESQIAAYRHTLLNGELRSVKRQFAETYVWQLKSRFLRFAAVSICLLFCPHCRFSVRNLMDCKAISLVESVGLLNILRYISKKLWLWAMNEKNIFPVLISMCNTHCVSRLHSSWALGESSLKQPHKLDSGSGKWWPAESRAILLKQLTEKEIQTNRKRAEKFDLQSVILILY